MLRKPAAGEKLLGPDYLNQEIDRLSSMLHQTKEKLVQSGIAPTAVEIELTTQPFTTVTDGIIDQYNKKPYRMVVIGRKKKSKSEEFVLGDVSVKLIRALEGTAVLVVKS